MEDESEKSFWQKLNNQLNSEIEDFKEKPLQAIGIFMLAMIGYMLLVLMVLYVLTRPYECTQQDTNTTYKVEGLKTLSQDCAQKCQDTEDLKSRVKIDCYNECTRVKCEYKPETTLQKEGFQKTR